MSWHWNMKNGAIITTLKVLDEEYDNGKEMMRYGYASASKKHHYERTPQCLGEY